MSKKKLSDNAGEMMTLDTQMKREVRFDVEMWRDIARPGIDKLDDGDQQIVEEAVASLLWYIGMATCTTADKPCDADYRRLRECCGQANYFRNVIREKYLKAAGVEPEEWYEYEGDPEPAEVGPPRPSEAVLH